MTTTTAPMVHPQRVHNDTALAAELRDVTVARRRRHLHQVLLDDVSVQIRRGEVTTLLSRHDRSAGTMLDLLDGRVQPSWGSVQVAGTEVTRLDRAGLHRFRHEHATRVWRGFGVQPRLTVGQNLVIAQRRSGREADPEWIGRVTEALGLHGMLGYPSAADADWRRARWAVARSLVGRPAVVLVDDVVSRGAWADRHGFLPGLRLAAHRLGVGIVLATRDPKTASVTDRVILLNRGRVVDDTAVA